MKKITAIALLFISIMASCGDKNHIVNKNRFIVYDIYIDDEMSCYRANKVDHDGWIDQRVIFKDTILRYSWMHNGFNSLVCRKTRNPEDGSLSGFSIINPESYKEGPMIVLDDLCDGGGTFLGIEEKLRELNPPSITLAVTHAVQKKGIERVAEVYDKVIITNSYEDWEDLPHNVEMIDLAHK